MAGGFALGRVTVRVVAIGNLKRVLIVSQCHGSVRVNAQ